MKAKELMIGDWVSYDGTPIKVENVYEDCINFQHDIPYVQEEFLIEETEIQPIPLTAEILEKNGIKWLSTEPSGRRTYCCNKPVIHCTYFPDSGWLVCVGACGSNKVRFVEISKVQHVHQLQHALRLCGIEKTIEL